MLKISRKIVRRLKWGIAGCGRFTEYQFIPVLHQLPKSKLISLYSSDINRAKFLAEKFSVSNVFNDYQSFLNSDIDCVYIASANSNHYWQVIQAAKAGKHILCEKPMALNSEQASEMVKVCDENHVKLAINYVHRFHPLVIKAKEIIEKGMIGKIISISTNYNFDLAPDNNFRFNKELSGGGALRDVGTHMIDLLRYFGGEISEIQGVMDNIIYKCDVDDFSAALVKFEKSGYGFFNVSFNVKKGFNRIEILGHNGGLSIENLIGKKHASCKLIIDLHGEAKKSFRKRANKLLYAVRAVQKSFLTSNTPYVSGTDGLINMNIMEELEKKCSLKPHLVLPARV